MTEVLLLKKLSVLLLSVLLLLISCREENGHKNDYISFPFSETMNITLDGEKYTVIAEASGPEHYIFTFTYPENIAKIALKYNNGGAFLIYEGIELPIDTQYSKENGILLIGEIFKITELEFADADIEKKSGIEYCVEKYKCPNGILSIYISNGSSSPSYIEGSLNGHSFTASFVNNN